MGSVEHGGLDIHGRVSATYTVSIRDLRGLRQLYRRSSFYTHGVTIGDVDFRLRIWPSGWAGDDGVDGAADTVSIYLYRHPATGPIVCGFWIGVIGETFEDLAVFDSAYLGGGTLLFSLLDVLCDLENHGLDVEVSVCFIKGNVLAYGRRPDYAYEPLKALQDDMGPLYQDPEHSDVVFVVGAVELKAHWCIICCRSEVFKRMFQIGMEEHRTGRITIDDFDVQFVKTFLYFLYTGRLVDGASDDMHFLVQLLKIADKYRVQSLSDTCISSMGSLFTPTSVLDVLAIAHEIGHIALKSQALTFATSQEPMLQDIIDLPKFDDLDPDIKVEMFTHRCSRKKGRVDGHEFAEGADWKRLSFAQLQRACAERRLSTAGQKRELVMRLDSHGSER